MRLVAADPAASAADRANVSATLLEARMSVGATLLRFAGEKNKAGSSLAEPVMPMMHQPQLPAVGARTREEETQQSRAALRLKPDDVLFPTVPFHVDELSYSQRGNGHRPNASLFPRPTETFPSRTRVRRSLSYGCSTPLTTCSTGPDSACWSAAEALFWNCIVGVFDRTKQTVL